MALLYVSASTQSLGMIFRMLSKSSTLCGYGKENAPECVCRFPPSTTCASHVSSSHLASLHQRTNFVPVMWFAAGLNKNSAAFEISPRSPSRPSGSFTSFASGSSRLERRLMPGVPEIGPGTSTFERTPKGPSSIL